MIRVLQIIGAMDRAGAETLVMNLYRNMDRSKIQFDFLVHTEHKCDYDAEIKSLGGHIYHIPRYTFFNRRAYRNAIRSFLVQHPEHRIIHGHIGSSAPIYLEEARRQGRFAIAHSHNNAPWTNPEEALFKLIARPVRWHADYFMACSPEAGLDRFGKKIIEGNSYTILNNGIIADEYKRTPTLIHDAKKALGLGSEPVFGHIGRFTTQKNHPFLISSFAAIKEQLPDAKLLLVGKGEHEEKIKRQIASLHLEDSVLFLGIRNDIPLILNAMDVFIFPSVFEGLGVALIEAQAAGLPCVVSDKIHDIAVLSDRVARMPLSSPETWANACIAAYERSKVYPDDQVGLIKQRGFDIQGTACWLQDFYLQHSN